MCAPQTATDANDEAAALDDKLREKTNTWEPLARCHYLLQTQWKHFRGTLKHSPAVANTTDG